MEPISPEKAGQLLIKYLNGELLPEDSIQLEQWLQQSPANRELLQQLTHPAYWQEQTQLYNSFNTAGNWERIHTLISEHGASRQQRFFPFIKSRWLRYAAVLVVCAGSGIYLLTGKWKNETSTVARMQETENDSQPGTGKAYLTLADGTKILPDSAANGRIAGQGNTNIIKLDNGQLIYDAKSPSGKVSMNTLTTPRGAQFHFTLADGTNVWLNAASSITFPASFEGKERTVQINGEVYFEVNNKHRQPFLVEIDGKTTVQVLGTSFNINSYPNENHIKTTLLDGSIKVLRQNIHEHGDTVRSEAVLKPGQQAITGIHTKNIQVSTIHNAEQLIAWKNGLFNFSGSDLRSVMRQLERWYNIKVEFRGSVNNILFDGEMYRNLPLSDVLDALKEMGLKCSLRGNHLIITN